MGRHMLRSPLSHAVYSVPLFGQSFPPLPSLLQQVVLQINRDRRKGGIQSNTRDTNNGNNSGMRKELEIGGGRELKHILPLPLYPWKGMWSSIAVFLYGS